ncbi:hypothetical protein EDB89DRAFT_1910693 [Lactarius sanguifluus]|nr:hypothetical protein EDB89DRAFT_1910693 [Lactarius sanguifluus]
MAVYSGLSTARHPFPFREAQRTSRRLVATTAHGPRPQTSHLIATTSHGPRPRTSPTDLGKADDSYTRFIRTSEKDRHCSATLPLSDLRMAEGSHSDMTLLMGYGYGSVFTFDPGHLSTETQGDQGLNRFSPLGTSTLVAAATWDRCAVQTLRQCYNSAQRYDNVAPQCCDINTSRLRYDTHTPCESYTDATNTDSDVAPQCYDTADAALQCYDINTARQHYDTHTLCKPSGDVTTPICRASPRTTRKPSGDVTTPIRCASPAATLRR